VGKDGVVASTEGIVVAIDGREEGGAERGFQLILERNHERTTGFMFWSVFGKRSRTCLPREPLGRFVVLFGKEGGCFGLECTPRSRLAENIVRKFHEEGRETHRKIVEGNLDRKRAIVHELEVIGKTGRRTGNIIYGAFDMKTKVLGGDLKGGGDVIGPLMRIAISELRELSY